MMNIWIKIFTKANILIYQYTNGQLGNRMGGQSVLLLHTTGRKSGKGITTSLSFYRDNNNYLLVASNWGKENQPDWYLNLVQHPRTTIQVGANTIPVEASKAQGEDYMRLWKVVTQKNKQYLKYQKSMQRRIPIVILLPTTPE